MLFSFDRQKETLKKKLENFSPSSEDVKDIKILVAGEIGAGKSSFINSVDSAFQGRICSRALADSAAGGDSHSFTRKVGICHLYHFLKDLEMSFHLLLSIEHFSTSNEDFLEIVYKYLCLYIFGLH